MSCADNATISGGTGEWFISTLNLDRGNDVNCTMTSGPCWINGSYNDGIALAMRSNTTFDANDGLIGMCGSGNQYYFERNEDVTRDFYNFMIDKVVGYGGGGSQVTGTNYGMKPSIFAPYDGYCAPTFRVHNLFRILGGHFDLLEQSGVGGYDDTSSGTAMMNLEVSGSMQMGTGGWRGECVARFRDADVNIQSPNLIDTRSSPLIAPDTNMTNYMDYQRANYPPAIYGRGDAYYDMGTARVRLGNLSSGPWEDNATIKRDSTWSDLVSGNAGYCRVLWPSGTNSALFDGTDDYINMGDVVKLETDYITLSAWVYTNSVLTAEDTIVGKWHNGATGRSYLMELYGQDVLFGLSPDGTNTNQVAFITPGAVISADTWHHIACVADGTDMIVYVDGADVGSTPYTSAIFDVSSDLMIGNYPTTHYLDGKIADVRIYDTPLTDVEISGTLAAINPAIDVSGNYADPDNALGALGWWKLNGTASGTLDSTDSVGSNDGTQNGGVKSGFVTITGTTFSMTGQPASANEGTKNLFLTNTYISGSNDFIVGTNSADAATQLQTFGTVVLD